VTRALVVIVACFMVVLLLAFWHRAQNGASSTAIIVGSKKFPESELIADMLVDILRARGYTVEERQGLGGTAIAFKALQTGAIDVYVEYTGTGLQEILKEETGGTAQQVYDRVREQFASRWRLEWLRPIGFEDKYALAMRLDQARRLGVETISQLVPPARTLRFGPSHEFLDRKDGYPRLRAVYGLDFATRAPMDHGLAYRALLDEKIDVIDVYTTDGNLDPTTVAVLIDDKHVLPPYYAAPVVRQDALDRNPGLRDALDALAGRIDDKTMQALNRRVEMDKVSSARVAREFLEKQGLVAASTSDADSDAAPRQRGLLGYMWAHRRELANLTGQHLYLTGVSMALAVIIGIPLGIAITRFRPAAGPVLGTASILQTVPSLALLTFMIPYLGLGEPPAIAALFLYGLLPIVRNTYAGIRAVDAGLLEVAEGMGLTAWQRLWLVELPLASAVIMAGVRTAVVIAIGTATLAAFIGAGGLGNPIVSGLTLNDDVIILSGAVPAALLAIGVDLLLGRLERLIVPRALARV
jgi:osmoprotectant transport system permease protein